MSRCTKHLRRTVQGVPPCPHCEAEQLRERLAAAEKRAEVAEAERDVLAEQVAIAVEALTDIEGHDFYGGMRGRAKAALFTIIAIAAVKP